MTEPIEIQPAGFFEFVARRGLVVVFVAMHPMHPFNSALPRHLADTGTIGRVELPELAAEIPVLLYLRDGLRSLGVTHVFEVMPGYYSFVDGRLLAWDSGLPGREDLDLVLRASLLGLVAYAITRNPMLIARATQLGAREAAALRMADAFRACEAEYRSNPWASGPPPPPPNPADELLNAYRLLGVDPSASDREVNTAWRKLQTELHPDHVAGDPGEFERRSRLATEINRARELIRAHRSRARRAA